MLYIILVIVTVTVSFSIHHILDRRCWLGVQVRAQQVHSRPTVRVYMPTNKSARATVQVLSKARKPLSSLYQLWFRSDVGFLQCLSPQPTCVVRFGRHKYPKCGLCQLLHPGHQRHISRKASH